MINIENETYLTLAEVANLLDLSEGTVLNWISENRIPSIKLGRRRIFNLASINEWLKSNIE
jgi:excisionase family DNA binding protein